MTEMVLPGTRRNGLIVAALVIVLLQAMVSPAGAVWTITTVDSVGDVGLFPSLVLDTGGYPHISYVDIGNTNLKYAAWNGTGWNISTVAGIGVWGGYPSLALDPAGNPRISYVDDSTTSTLNYAVWTGTGWTTETVDSSSVGMAAYTSMVLNASGYPRISYQGIANDLKYAAWNGTGWDIRTVDSPGGDPDVAYVYSSLALDSSGSPRISYLNVSGTEASVKYAAWNGAGWDIETVNSSANNVGTRTSLALDPSGHPRISYQGIANDLEYAAWIGTRWDTATVDSAGDPVFSSLALDRSGNPRISYYSITTQDLKYAEWNGASWRTTTVDSTGNVGYASSLVLDPSGSPRIGYLDVGNYDLKYAARKPLTADFSAVPVSGSAPLGVAFAGTAANGTPSSWTWYFGDGGTAFGQNPSYTFTSPGTYTVFLTAVSAEGETYTRSRPGYITATSSGTGAATAIVLDPAAAATVYAGVDGYGVYRSTDSGSAWTHLALPTGANLQIRALAPFRGSGSTATTIYAGSYGGGVYRSADGGATWDSCELLPDQNVLSLAANATGGVFAGTPSGVYTSADECTSWTVLDNGLP